MILKSRLALAAFLAGLAVACGAFGAHALRDLPEKYLEAYRTGVDYHFYHALALLGFGALEQAGLISFRAGTLLWGITCAAVLLFSGSLYAYALTGIKIFAMITPVGGLLFLIGWGCAVFLLMRSKERR